VSVALALLSSVLWGFSDFLGGIVVRRSPVTAIAFLSQASGLVVAGVATLLLGASTDIQGVMFALASGVSSTVSLLAFFKAMELGLISIASPILGMGSIFAFGLSILFGERPGIPAMMGAVLALTGAVITSFKEQIYGPNRRASLTFALLSAVAFGVSLYLLGRAGYQTGSAIAVFCGRLSSTLLLLLVILRLRPAFRVTPQSLLEAAAVGIGSVSALFLFGLAAEMGLISIASILSSLYPVVTVSLAHVFLGERLAPTQFTGVSLVIGGVLLATVGR
jgi:drug/metabolite transporter (DMT)-like permease